MHALLNPNPMCHLTAEQVLLCTWPTRFAAPTKHDFWFARELRSTLTLTRHMPITICEEVMVLTGTQLWQ